MTAPPWHVKKAYHSKLEQVCFQTRHFVFPPQNERDSLSLNSYVVASSVGNCTIRNLKDPVKIEIVHLNYQVMHWPGLSPEQPGSVLAWSII